MAYLRRAFVKYATWPGQSLQPMRKWGLVRNNDKNGDGKLSSKELFLPPSGLGLSPILADPSEALIKFTAKAPPPWDTMFLRAKSADGAAFDDPKALLPNYPSQPGGTFFWDRNRMTWISDSFHCRFIYDGILGRGDSSGPMGLPTEVHWADSFDKFVEICPTYLKFAGIPSDAAELAKCRQCFTTQPAYVTRTAPYMWGCVEFGGEG